MRVESSQCLYQEASKWLLYFFYHVVIQQQNTFTETENRPWPKVKPASVLLLDFWPLKLQEINFCRYKSPSLRHMAVTAFVSAKAGSSKTLSKFCGTWSLYNWEGPLAKRRTVTKVDVCKGGTIMLMFYNLPRNLTLGPSLLR